MEITYKAGTNGTFRITLKDYNDNPIDLTGCTVMFKLAYTNDKNALISKNCTINENICEVELTSADTQILNFGTYDIQLIVTNGLGKVYASERLSIPIDEIIQ